MLGQIAARRTVELDRPGRRDVVGRDRIAEDRQRPRTLDVGQRLRRHRHAGEIGRVLDIGGSGRPVVGVAAGHLDRPPAVIAAEHVGIARTEHVAVDMKVDKTADLVVRRPDVGEEHVLAVLGLADGRLDHVVADRAHQRIGDHQRRRSEIVGAAIGRDAALEIAVARKDRRSDQVIVVDRLADRLGQRPRIADAGGAAIADQVEAKRIQVFAKATGIQIIGHHLAARRKAGLDPRLGRRGRAPAPCGRPGRRRPAPTGWTYWCSW